MGRVLVWLMGSLVVLGSAITGLNMLNPKPVDPGSPLATQTTDGQSRFSPAAQDFFEQRGEVVVRVGGEPNSATALGLPDSGGRRVAFEQPCDVHLLLPARELVIEDAESIEFFMRGDEIDSVEIVYSGSKIANALDDAGFSPGDLGIHEEEGVRIGARLAGGELNITVRVLD